MSDLARQVRTWVNFFALNPDVRINYLSIMEHGGVSRRKSLDIIREMRDQSLVIGRRSRYIGTNLELTNKGLELTASVSSVSTVTAVQLVSSIYNSYTASTVNKATNKFLDEVEGEEIEVGYEFFKSSSSSDDELVREREKHMAQKKAEYVEAREKKAQQRKDLHRSKLASASWSCKDVAYEFADRMADIWTIAPFSVTQSRFVQALAVFRKQHDTNGEIELKIIELFFATLKQDKYTDGNHLWRAFLYKAPSLVQVARESIVSVEERETNVIRDQELAERKLSMFDED
ncbi:hypothetical protein UFOVP115_33 [uncultured Caudovirales phage]|uniref:Uncharacterized protein n=1 Tax=uncultured Caudovirales phage TaxID=2100421 RepID=A0A6J5L460_9CAUD|nr:hypothetical protein UFOVP115_33 [uncultured Caudovirales phage]